MHFTISDAKFMPQMVAPAASNNVKEDRWSDPVAPISYIMGPFKVYIIVIFGTKCDSSMTQKSTTQSSD